MRGGSVAATAKENGNATGDAARTGGDDGMGGNDSNGGGNSFVNRQPAPTSNVARGKVQNAPINPYNRPSSGNSISRSKTRPNSSGVKNPYARPASAGNSSRNYNQENTATLSNPAVSNSVPTRQNGAPASKPINPYANRNGNRSVSNSSVARVQNHDRQEQRFNGSKNSFNSNGVNQNNGRTVANQTNQTVLNQNQSNRQSVWNSTNQNGQLNQNQFHRQDVSSHSSNQYGQSRNQFNKQTNNGHNAMNQNPNNRQSVWNGSNQNGQNIQRELNHNQFNAQAGSNNNDSNQNTQNVMNQSQINRQSLSNDFNQNAQSSMNQSQINRQLAPCELSHQNKNTTGPGLKEKPIASLFRQQGATSTSSRPSSAARVNTSQSSTAKSQRSRE